MHKIKLNLKCGRRRWNVTCYVATLECDRVHWNARIAVGMRETPLECAKRRWNAEGGVGMRKAAGV